MLVQKLWNLRDRQARRSSTCEMPGKSSVKRGIAGKQERKNEK
jgi:hypothetical protein